MSKIAIGKAGQHDAVIDLDVLLATRLLIQANSGGGKSWLLRRLAEQFYGKVPVIIIDPEGEFASLREKFDYFLVGEGGDVPAHERSAPLLAETLLSLRANAVCDLYETFRKNPMGRHLWVKAFLGGLLDAPKSLWRPTVVIVDEAHVFCPEKGESPAEGVMVGLATAGRKRHFCPIWATQRLALLQKDGSSQLQNRMVGLTFEDVDVDRASALLSVSKEEVHEFKKVVKTLDPGNFFAFGRAISKERILVHVGPVATSHEAETGKADAPGPPPPPDKIKAMLPKLADLPAQAEEKARTIAEFKTEIRSLKAQLRAQPKQRVEGTTSQKDIQRAVHVALTKYGQDIARDAAHRNAAIRKLERCLSQIHEMAEENIGSAGAIADRPLPEIPGVEIQKGEPRLLVQARSQEGAPAREYRPRPESSGNGNSDLKGPHKKILRALAELASIERREPLREMVAAWAGYSPNGGAFSNPLGALRSMGLVEYPGGGRIALTEEGAKYAGVQAAPDQEEIHRRVQDILRGPERKILNVLLEAQGETLSKQELAERAGYSEGGGAFSNPLGALRTAGFVEYPGPGKVRACDWLFIE